MTYQREMVSPDPGPEWIPATSQKSDDDREEHEVIGGLEATADTPEEAQPLREPHELIGEWPATGSNANPG